MMNYKDFINLPITNRENESGVVISFDEGSIVIQYQETVKKYHPSVAFRNGYITFNDLKVQEIISRHLLELESIAKVKLDINAINLQKFIIKKDKVNKIYRRLEEKNRALKELFGSDFNYPPLVKFERKFKYLINKKASSKLFTIY
jgi:hypothetical protein